MLHGSIVDVLKEAAMIDMLLVIAILLLFGTAHAYVEACARLKGKGQS